MKTELKALQVESVAFCISKNVERLKNILKESTSCSDVLIYDDFVSEFKCIDTNSKELHIDTFSTDIIDLLQRENIISKEQAKYIKKQCVQTLVII